MENKKELIPHKRSLKEFVTTNLLPDFLLNMFQYYLIIDKLFGIELFGRLSWWQVFIPTIVSLAVTVIFLRPEDLEE